MDIDNFVVEITQFRCTHKATMGLFELINLLKKINAEFGTDIDQQYVMQSVVDYFFQTTAKYFKIQGFTFFLFVVLPFLTQIFNTDLTEDQVQLCLHISMLTQLLFFILELIQFKVYRQSYFEFNNLTEVLMFALYLWYYIERLGNLSSTLPRFQKAEVSTIDNQFKFSLLQASILILGSLKVLSFMRVYKEFGQLVKLMTKVIRDMLVFCIFFFYWLFFASFMYDMLGSKIDGADYQGLPPQSFHFIQAFRNSLGDIAVPTYDNYWGTFEGNTKAWVMVQVIWFTFFAMQMFLSVMLLNFLIAIIS